MCAMSINCSEGSVSIIIREKEVSRFMKMTLMLKIVNFLGRIVCHYIIPHRKCRRLGSQQANSLSFDHSTEVYSYRALQNVVIAKKYHLKCILGLRA
jgi:hypothetical protein